MKGLLMIRPWWHSISTKIATLIVWSTSARKEYNSRFVVLLRYNCGASCSCLTLFLFGVQLGDFDLKFIHSFAKGIHPVCKQASLDKQLTKHILSKPACDVKQIYKVSCSTSVGFTLPKTASGAHRRKSHTHGGGETREREKYSLREPSWRMMLASVMLVTHSSSLFTAVGRVWRQRCRGSIFRITKGMMINQWLSSLKTGNTTRQWVPQTHINFVAVSTACFRSFFQLILYGHCPHTLACFSMHVATCTFINTHPKCLVQSRTKTTVHRSF